MLKLLNNSYYGLNEKVFSLSSEIIEKISFKSSSLNIFSE